MSEGMSDGARLFDEMASSYDSNLRPTVPDLDGFHEAVFEGLPFERDEELRVLDLGSGTGSLSEVVAERFPKARIALADFSAEMLKVARQRFAGMSERFEFFILDYVREPLPGEEGGYDLVVSALSFHHLAHEDERKTFEKVHAALAGGGWFVNADKIPTEPSESGQRHEHHHEGHLKAVERAGLQTQMEWLREAGFEEVECRYDRDEFVVYRGRKAGIKTKKSEKEYTR